jgi:RimJ/RimL family protein N-acetyltransferase
LGETYADEDPVSSILEIEAATYQQTDFEGFAALNADSSVWRHVGGPLSREHAARLFERFVTGECLTGNEVWAVVDKSSGDYIGHCWFDRQGTEPPELGLLIAAHHWGQGIEVANALLNYAREVCYARVIATADTDNSTSIRVLEHVGMKREGEMRDEEGVHFVYAMNSDSEAAEADMT